MNKKQSSPQDGFQSPKGMHDILPADQFFWEKIRRAAHDIAESYRFSRIDTTLLEPLSLFERSLGASSDVVEKQMFVLKTKGDDMLVLRPEGTASIARSYIEHNLSQLGRPLRLYYIGPMFRYEQPQAGRFRQFHQLGFEILSDDDDPIYDAQAILIGFRFMENLKMKQLLIHVNSIGCKTCRPMYRKKLVDYYRAKLKENAAAMCSDCERRLADNPLRLLDCKDEACLVLRADAPISLNSLCAYCKAHLKSVFEYLDELQLPYVVDHYLVRGLDYYNRTVFEIFADKEKLSSVPGATQPASIALGGGGRYDYLTTMLGGRETAAVGVALGLERLVDVMKTLTPPEALLHAKPAVFLIHIGDAAKRKSLSLLEMLRRERITVGESLSKDSLKAQLKQADKCGALFALIFGQKEALEESIIIRDLQTGAQETVPLTHLLSELKRKLR